MSSSYFPPPPSPSIDWPSIGFRVHPVNGHSTSTFSTTTNEWTSPSFTSSPILPLHGLSPALNYGQQAYEGLKAHRHPENDRITLFRPRLNAARLSHSAAAVSIPPIPEELFLRAVSLAVARNAEFVPPHPLDSPSHSEGEGGAALYIRPLVFGSAPQLGLAPPTEYTFVVFVTPTGVYHGVKAVDALVVEDFDRAAPMGTGNAKVGGNYAPVLQYMQRAREEGFGITLHLDSKTRSEVDEFSTSAFIGVKRTKNKAGEEEFTLVQPDSKNAIASVTADSVLEIGKRLLGCRVEKRRVPVEELGEFDEVIAAGTAAGLVPVRSVSLRSRGERFEYECGGEEGKGGEVCRGLLATLRGIQNGELEDVFGWNYVVGEEDARD